LEKQCGLDHEKPESFKEELNPGYFKSGQKMHGVKCMGGCGVAFGNVTGEGVVAPKSSSPIYACRRCFTGGGALQSCNIALCNACMKEFINKQPNKRPSRTDR
jgi:hypothetical protein